MKCLAIFTVRCTIVQSVVLWSHVICLSFCLSVCLDHDHIGWKSWKLTARTISPTSSLFVAQRSSTYSQGNMEKLWGENVRSTPTSITSGWIESTKSHMILGGGVAGWCLFTFVGALRGNLCDSTAFLWYKAHVWHRHTDGNAVAYTRTSIRLCR